MNFDPVNMRIAVSGFVVFADVFADETQFADLYLHASFFQALAADGLRQRLAMSLSAAREDVPFAIFVVDPAPAIRSRPG